MVPSPGDYPISGTAPSQGSTPDPSLESLINVLKEDIYMIVLANKQVRFKRYYVLGATIEYDTNNPGQAIAVCL